MVKPILILICAALVVAGAAPPKMQGDPRFISQYGPEWPKPVPRGSDLAGQGKTIIRLTQYGHDGPPLALMTAEPTSAGGLFKVVIAATPDGKLRRFSLPLTKADWSDLERRAAALRSPEGAVPFCILSSSAWEIEVIGGGKVKTFVADACNVRSPVSEFGGAMHGFMGRATGCAPLVGKMAPRPLFNTCFSVKGNRTAAIQIAALQAGLDADGDIYLTELRPLVAPDALIKPWGRPAGRGPDAMPAEWFAEYKHNRPTARARNQVGLSANRVSMVGNIAMDRDGSDASAPRMTHHYRQVWARRDGKWGIVEWVVDRCTITSLPADPDKPVIDLPCPSN